MKKERFIVLKYDEFFGVFGSKKAVNRGILKDMRKAIVVADYYVYEIKNKKVVLFT